MHTRVLVLLTACLLAGVVWGQVDDDLATVTLDVDTEVSIVVGGDDVGLIFEAHENGSWIADSGVSTLTVYNTAITEDEVAIPGIVTVTVERLEGPESHKIDMTLTSIGQPDGCLATLEVIEAGVLVDDGLLFNEVTGQRLCNLTWTATSPVVGTPPGTYVFEVTFTLIVDDSGDN